MDFSTIRNAVQVSDLLDGLAEYGPPPRDQPAPNLISHSIADILRERIFAIACGYPDGNDLDVLRKDPAFKMACGRPHPFSPGWQ